MFVDPANYKAPALYFEKHAVIIMSIEQLYAIFLECRQVTIDSRTVTPGALFFAIRGERFDGNNFAGDALEAGAAYAVVDKSEVVKGKRFLLVDDALKTLQELARYHRRQFEIPVIGITGSNGKTTTKELISAVVGSHYALHFTRGNFNNHIGVPLTLLAMPPETEVAVIEMGANHQGEIDLLSQIAEPTHALITNIGKAHLEGFGGIEGVKKGKSELYRFLAETGGLAFINRDAAFLEELAKPVKQKIYYKRCEELNQKEIPYGVQVLAVQPFVRVAFLDDRGQRLEINTQLIGVYNVDNVMTAITLGKYFKVPGAKIKRSIEAYVPQNNRSQVLKKDTNTFILDAYNANPSSMLGALDHFQDMDVPHKVVILGDMLELGPYAAAEHESIARYAAEQDFDRVLLVGAAFEAGALQLGLRHFPDVAALREWWQTQSIEHTHILIKGSRRIQLEDLVK